MSRCGYGLTALCRRRDPAVAPAGGAGCPGESRLVFVWASDRCTLRRDRESDTWAQTKPLRKLRRRDYGLRRVLVVDDSPEKHTRNYANLVAVQAFEGDPADDELPRLARYLEQLAPEPDHRRVEKRRWRRRCGQRRRPFL